MYHVPMCKVCGEHEVGTFTGSAEYCSEKCQMESCYSYDAAGDGWGHDDIQAMYDDDPSPYAGTYSEE
jgi:hypothetical protein